MFSLKPILVDQKIELPSCMYKLKPVSGVTSENMSDSNNSSVSETFATNIDKALKLFDNFRRTILNN